MGAHRGGGLAGARKGFCAHGIAANAVDVKQFQV